MPRSGLSGGPATRSRSGSIKFAQRCGQPGQQQGLRFPSLRLEQPHSIRRVLVSAFLADSIQQIHSLRARGVMSSHVSSAFTSEVSAFFRSAGRSWTTPPEISFALRAWMRRRLIERDLLSRKDVAKRSTERIEPDNRQGQPDDCSPILEIADDAFPRCVQ